LSITDRYRIFSDQELGSGVIAGWINYYGRFRLYCMSKVFRALNVRLVRWVMNKYKRYRRRKFQARQFEHWKYGFTPSKF